MDNKDSGSNFALWIPGSAVLLSLVVSTFALTRAPFFESRPAGSQFQVEQPIEARLWQDPFDALERFRKRVKASGEKQQACTRELSDDAEPASRPTLPSVVVVPIEAGPYADEVELRRRVRYALLAGLKNTHLVPEDEQHVRCLSLAADLAPLPVPADAAVASTDNPPPGLAELPYESFAANPFDPPRNPAGTRERVLVFWLKQQYLDVTPLARLEQLRLSLSARLAVQYPQQVSAEGIALKVIGPSNSSVLRDMLREDRELAAEGKPSVPQIEIYSPLATADKKLLLRGLAEREPAPGARQPLKLLRTISDDATLARLLLDELQRRSVDPVQGLRCRPGAPLVQGRECRPGGRRGSMGRVALISEWDSFYARALTESFKAEVGRRAGLQESEQFALNDWVPRYSYLRGLDGRLPEDAAASNAGKDSGKDSKSSSEIDLAPLEKADGNSQLDYLRRLADYIAREDQEQRSRGGSGIGAIGVLGTDAYDKLLVLQALKSRMPAKLYFSTDLDARMLQRGQAETARNLVLAAPYGLTLTRDLQQDVPPFRDSLQSAVFVAVLAAQAPQSFETKRERFDYSSSPLLSPGIYEVGISGFIALASSSVDLCQASASIRARSGGAGNEGRQGIMQVDCLQDPPPPPYPEPSGAMGASFDRLLGFWHAGPLSLLLLGLAIFLGWWWTSSPLNHGEQLPAWVRNLPLALYVLAAVAGWGFTLDWRVEYLWATFVLILLGIVCSQLNRRLRRHAQGARHLAAARGLFDSQAYYLLLPAMIFVLVVLWCYQQRRELTDNGLGEPMFLFEGISAWPTAALRLLAVLISLAALAWGWRSLRLNRLEIEQAYHLPTQASSLWRQWPRLGHRGRPRGARAWLEELGRSLFLVLFPLSTTSMTWLRPISRGPAEQAEDERPTLSFRRFWREHCICGTFGARMIRAILATWIFVVATSILLVFWPFEGAPIRGGSSLWKYSWLLPTLVFQLLVFWVVDANRLLSRFIRQLSRHRAVWPWRLQREHEAIFHRRQHPCIDAWMDMQLIARRSAAVNRLIYAPTLVLLILIASRSSYFDNWPTPPSLVISYLLTALILFASALSLRRAAEKARGLALQQVDDYLLKTPAGSEGYDKFKLIRERIAALNSGAFSRYSEEPLVRALLLSLTGIGGSAIVDALNFAKF
ncbi:hypothetical protein ACLUTX_11780 [Enterobacterales bacterium AE_CKDN230030158-1A_HGKHYDSX7]